MEPDQGVEQEQVGLQGGERRPQSALLDLEVDATGSTYALDGQAQQIQVLDARGAHVGTIGRPRRWTR